MRLNVLLSFEWWPARSCCQNEEKCKFARIDRGNQVSRGQYWWMKPTWLFGRRLAPAGRHVCSNEKPHPTPSVSSVGTACYEAAHRGSRSHGGNMPPPLGLVRRRHGECFLFYKHAAPLELRSLNSEDGYLLEMSRQKEMADKSFNRAPYLQ